MGSPLGKVLRAKGFRLRRAMAAFAGILPVLSALADNQNQNNSPAPGDYVCVNRAPHSRVWQRFVLQTNASGSVSAARKGRDAKMDCAAAI